MITINKPKIDQRQFVGGKLKNNIKYIVINDKHLERSYVSVSVNIGTFANPKEYGGLAHFLEHMLFQGSTKYPDEAYYFNKLNEMGGHSNAYTDSSETVYFFNVLDNGLVEIIDIFSRFFIDPLFTADNVYREVNAVNNEHNKNIHSDIWKYMQLTLYLTNDDSTMNNFGTGNLETLNKPDIREQMIQFYKKYYNSDNISICIVSSKPIEEIKQMIDSTFGLIPKKLSTEFKLSKPFYSMNGGKTFYMETLATIYDISYIWEIDKFGSSSYNCFQILGLILNNSSYNSLYTYLKNMGYLNNISTEFRKEGQFIIFLSLTKKGYKNMGIVDSILLGTLNNIINMIDFEKVATYYMKISHITFDNLNKFDNETLCNMLSVNHSYEETKNVFDSIFLIKDIKLTKFYRDTFKKFLVPENMIRIITSQKNKLKILGKPKKIEHYDSLYYNISFPHNKKINSINHIIDTNNSYMDIKPKLLLELKQEIPILLGERQWYGGCSQYNEPTITILLQLNNIKYFSSAKNSILTSISCSILNTLCGIILYKPIEVGYNISFSPNRSQSCINININGLNDINKLYQVINDLNEFLSNINNIIGKISNDYIFGIIQNVKEDYNDIKFMNPADYSAYLFRKNSLPTEYNANKILSELNDITIDMIQNYVDKLLLKSALTSIIYGNINPNTNLFTNTIFSNLFENSSYILPTLNELKSIDMKHPNKKEKSNCITYYYKIGKFVPKEYLLLLLTTNIISQPFFDELRTKEQLGYLVNIRITHMLEEYFIVQKIQSDKMVSIVEEKIYDFNKKINSIISKVDFNTFLETLRSQLNEIDNSMDDKINRYFPEIISRQYMFNRNEILLKQLENITVDDVIEFAKKYLSNPIKYIIRGN